MGLVYEWVGSELSDWVELNSSSDISDKWSDISDDSDMGVVGSDNERIAVQCGLWVTGIVLSSCSEAGWKVVIGIDVKE